MATVKEVQLMDGENMVTPKVWADSIYNLDESKYTTHTHDDRYYTESEMNTKLDGKSNKGHTHDDRYYTESEMDAKLDNKSNTWHGHTGISRVSSIPLNYFDTDNLSYTIPSSAVGEVHLYYCDTIGAVVNTTSVLKYDVKIRLSAPTDGVYLYLGGTGQLRITGNDGNYAYMPFIRPVGVFSYFESEGFELKKGHGQYQHIDVIDNPSFILMRIR